MAFALASLANSFKVERWPRISAKHRILPEVVSKTFVWVLTWARGFGEAAGLVEVEVGRVVGCMVVDEEDEEKSLFFGRQLELRLFPVSPILGTGAQLSSGFARRRPRRWQEWPQSLRPPPHKTARPHFNVLLKSIYPIKFLLLP